MKPFVLLSFISLFIVSCGGTTEEENNSVAQDSDSTTSVLNADGEIEPTYCPDESWQCFKGTIDGKHDIVIEIGRTFYANSNLYGISGYYFYTSNNIGFDLSGEQEQERVTLERFYAGEVEETFYWEYDNDMNIHGWWRKEGSGQLDIQIEEVRYDHSKASDFLEGVLQITDDPMTTNLIMSFHDLEELYISEDGCLQATEDFDGYYHGQKIRLDDYYESSGGGHTDDAIYVLLPQTENNGLTQIAQIEYMNMWENDYHDYDIDEDDEYGLNPTYFVTLKVFDFKGGEMSESQSLSWDGDGEADAYFFENRLVVLTTDGKEVVYFSVQEGAFVEH